jgi:predicted ATPase
MNPTRLEIENLGQIAKADVTFGDLTVLVGPQATGKSIFLQTLKLLVDSGPVLNELKRFNIDWGGKLPNLLELYFGEGMSRIHDASQTKLAVDGARLDLDAAVRGKWRKEEHLFYIPAQRVLSLREGLTRPFTEYRSGDPFVVREFSDQLHQLVQTEFTQTAELFPKSNRLKQVFREKLDQHIFGGFGLRTSSDRFQRRMVLHGPEGTSDLPYLVWSAGQREFAPLLLGLYWLIPPAKVSRRGKLQWVVIEELEMGLHPNAISVTMLLVVELLSRGYKVCLSTHSPHVLDVVWALRTLRAQNGLVEDVLDLFDLPKTPPTKEVAEAVLQKDFRVYFFQRDGQVQDISGLDPSAEEAGESGWGGLSGFSGHVGDIVARVVARNENPSRIPA